MRVAGDVGMHTQACELVFQILRCDRRSGDAKNLDMFCLQQFLGNGLYYPTVEQPLGFIEGRSCGLHKVLNRISR